MDIEKLATALIEATTECWAANQRPLLLSNLPAELAKRGIQDYKSILEDSSLKAFAQDLAAKGQLEVVTHPSYSAKVGLVPHGETYDYSVEVKAPKPKPLTER